MLRYCNFLAKASEEEEETVHLKSILMQSGKFPSGLHVCLVYLNKDTITF